MQTSSRQSYRQTERQTDRETDHKAREASTSSPVLDVHDAGTAVLSQLEGVLVQLFAQLAHVVAQLVLDLVQLRPGLRGDLHQVEAGLDVPVHRHLARLVLAVRQLLDDRAGHGRGGVHVEVDPPSSLQLLRRGGLLRRGRKGLLVRVAAAALPAGAVRGRGERVSAIGGGRAGSTGFVAVVAADAAGGAAVAVVAVAVLDAQAERVEGREGQRRRLVGQHVAQSVRG